MISKARLHGFIQAYTTLCDEITQELDATSKEDLTTIIQLHKQRRYFEGKIDLARNLLSELRALETANET